MSECFVSKNVTDHTPAETIKNLRGACDFEDDSGKCNFITGVYVTRCLEVVRRVEALQRQEAVEEAAAANAIPAFSMINNTTEPR